MIKADRVMNIISFEETSEVFEGSDVWPVSALLPRREIPFFTRPRLSLLPSRQQSAGGFRSAFEEGSLSLG
jgi:hypothetical protein